MIRKTNQLVLKPGEIDHLNTILPIKMRHLEPVINTITHKYPHLKKSQITLIVKTLLEEMRENLIRGNTITIKDLLFNMRLYTFCRMKNNKLIFNTQVQVSTPRYIKNANK